MTLVGLLGSKARAAQPHAADMLLADTARSGWSPLKYGDFIAWDYLRNEKYWLYFQPIVGPR